MYPCVHPCLGKTNGCDGGAKCMNGGTCIPNTSKDPYGYFCICTPDFKGDTCQSEKIWNNYESMDYYVKSL